MTQQDPQKMALELRRGAIVLAVLSQLDEEQTQGPPRRVYSLTPEGEQGLDRWAEEIERSRERLERFLEVHRRERGGRGDPPPDPATADS